MQHKNSYDDEKQNQLSNSRNYLVVKSNDLIQRTRFNLSTQEQKIILYLISKIKPEDTDFQYYTFDIKDLCRICGIEYNGKNYQNFKESIRTLRDKSFWVETEEKIMLLSWLQEVEINKQETTVSLRLDDRLKPYLLSIGENFTKYQLEHTLLLKSKYSIRLYEFFICRAFRGYFEIGLDELKQALDITGYEVYKDFRVNVIDKALQEINQFTDLNISFSPIRTNRTITGLHFTIEYKEDTSRFETMLMRNSILDKADNSRLQQLIGGFDE